MIRDLAFIWLAALLAGYACARAKQPAVGGYILAGIAIGPHGLGLIGRTQQITVLAEFGVALLLFALGVEVSLRNVVLARGKVVVVGVLQLVGTILAGWSLVGLAGLAPNLAGGFLFGAICALSSTAVVTKVLMDRGESDALHGRILVPVLLVQDLGLVPLVSMLPALQKPGPDFLFVLGLQLGKAALLVAAVVWVALKIVPAILERVVRSNSRELFLLTVISLCLGIAIVSNQLGLSLALGAFLSGMIVSESPYGHQALADLVPLRDLFATIFFVSVGMLLDPSFISAHYLAVLSFVVLLVVFKAAIAMVSALVATPSVWSALLVGVGLAQVGEFSFVLATLGFQAGIITDAQYNLFLAGAVVTLMFSPALMSATPSLARKFAERRLFADPAGPARTSETAVPLSGHIVLCGFGRIGRNLGLVLKMHDIPFVVVEVNAGIIEDLESSGIVYVYGDALSRETLDRANLRQAGCLVVTVPDPVAAITIIHFARQANPDIRIVARAHRTEDIEVFRAAGANAVVQPEFESSIEITRLALLSLNLSNPEIQEALRDIRLQRYTIFQPDIAEVELSHLITFPTEELFGAWFRVGQAEVNGRTIKELGVRRRSGATVLAVRRGEEIVAHPDAEFTLRQHDDVYVVGNAEQLRAFEREFELARFCELSEVTSDEISAAPVTKQQSIPGPNG